MKKEGIYVKGAERRREIALLLRSKQPITGAELARRLGVSRQVIVQDVALLRAEETNILSTSRGYLLYDPADYPWNCRRVFYVRHTTEQVRDELLSIVELGGRVLDVSVEHALYGVLRVDLLLDTAAEVEDFCARLQESGGAPLKSLTKDCHYHTVLTNSERLLDLIEAELRKKGYLLSANS